MGRTACTESQCLTRVTFTFLPSLPDIFNLLLSALFSDILFLMAQKPLLGQGLLIIEALRSGPDTLIHSVGLLWMCDQPDAKTST